MEPSCDVSELGINISSRAEFPINVLSNFAPTNFELDGVPVYSMEGFLQSLKLLIVNCKPEYVHLMV